MEMLSHFSIFCLGLTTLFFFVPAPWLTVLPAGLVCACLKSFSGPAALRILAPCLLLRIPQGSWGLRVA